MLRVEVRHIDRIGRPANFKLGIRSMKSRITGSAMTSKVKGHDDGHVVCLTGVGP